MSLRTHIDKLNSGDPVTVAWVMWELKMRNTIEAQHPFPDCNIIASEQVFMRSASKRTCYLCGHNGYRQTTEIAFPPLAKSGYICKECDE